MRHAYVAIRVLVGGLRAFIRFLMDNGRVRLKRIESLEMRDGLEEKRIFEILREIYFNSNVCNLTHL